MTVKDKDGMVLIRADCSGCNTELDIFIAAINDHEILCMECYMRLENEDSSPNITAMLQDTMENEVRE